MQERPRGERQSAKKVMHIQLLMIQIRNTESWILEKKCPGLFADTFEYLR